MWGGPPDRGRRHVGLCFSRYRRAGPGGPAVAVGTAVTRCPPHRPVLALLTHTVLTSDMGMGGVKAHVRIGLQDLHWWKQATQAFTKLLPRQTAALASSPKRLVPESLHVVAECF